MPLPDSVPARNTFWTSPYFAWGLTLLVELMLLVAALKDPIPWLAASQFILLFIPPILLGMAVRTKTYAPLFPRLLTVWIIASTLDLLHLH